MIDQATRNTLRNIRSLLTLLEKDGITHKNLIMIFWEEVQKLEQYLGVDDE